MAFGIPEEAAFLTASSAGGGEGGSLFAHSKKMERSGGRGAERGAILNKTQHLGEAAWARVAQCGGRVAGMFMRSGFLAVRERLLTLRGFLHATPPAQAFATVAAACVLRALGHQATRRSIYFWTQAFPIYLHYRFADRRMQNWPATLRKQRFNQLHDHYAPHVYNILINMGGFFLKLGQIGGTRQDFVPEQFTRLLHLLEDQVPAEKDPLFAIRVITRQLQQLGYTALTDVFASFDPQPIGAASIGQCHRATLTDGRQVVVKIVRPNAKRLFEDDLALLESFCRLAQPQLVRPWHGKRKLVCVPAPEFWSVWPLWLVPLFPPSLVSVTNIHPGIYRCRFLRSFACNSRASSTIGRRRLTCSASATASAPNGLRAASSSRSPSSAYAPAKCW